MKGPCLEYECGHDERDHPAGGRCHGKQSLSKAIQDMARGRMPAEWPPRCECRRYRGRAS